MNVHVAIPAPVGAAIKQVIGLTGEHAYTEFVEAKLVLVQSKEDLIRLHRGDKYFVVFGQRDPGILPQNAEWHNVPEIVRLISLISDEAAVDPKIAGLKNISPVSEEVSVQSVDSGVLRVLVVDDTERNRALAKELLVEHSLTIASSYGQAIRLLDEKEFDVVLTDLYLPMSGYHGALSVEAIEIGKLVPYGLLIALEAARRGADVAIVTDANHHRDVFSAAFDALRAPYAVGGKKLLLINYLGNCELRNSISIVQ